MRVAIVGSAKLSESQRAHARYLTQMIVAHCSINMVNPTLVSGGAEGVDSIAEEEWDLMGWPKEIYYPKHPRWKPEGYEERNIKIATTCDILYAIRAKDSKTYGSGFTADYAEKLGKDVWRYYV